MHGVPRTAVPVDGERVTEMTHPRMPIVVMVGAVTAFAALSAPASPHAAPKRTACAHLTQGRYAPKPNPSPCLVANRYWSGFVFPAGRSTDVSNFGAFIRFNPVDATHEPYSGLHVGNGGGRVQITRVAFKDNWPAHDPDGSRSPCGGAPSDPNSFPCPTGPIVVTETVRFRATPGMKLTRVFLEHPHGKSVAWTPLRHGQRSVTVTRTFSFDDLSSGGTAWVESASNG